jgi:hypothetical protein
MICLFTPKHNLTSKKVEVLNDTIVFVPKFDFRGRCEQHCNVYVAGDKCIETFNGIENEKEIYYNLYVECPTKLRLEKGKRYKFLVTKFKSNSCTTIVDTVYGTKSYRLIKELKN